MESFVFVTVNHNCFSETKEYILSIMSLNGIFKKHIIIIDNSTTEDDYIVISNYIKENNFEFVSVVRTENEGYFQALNRGIEISKIKNLNPKFYIVGNNDITFQDNFLDTLHQMKINHNELIIAPDVITKDGSHENPHSINRVSKIKRFSFDIFYSNYYISKFINMFYGTNKRKYKSFNPHRQEIYMAIGAVYVISQHFFEYFAKLWDEVFLYGEEAVLAGQIASVKGKIIYEPSLKCYHNESSTTSKINNKKKYKIIQKSYRIYSKYL